MNHLTEEMLEAFVLEQLPLQERTGLELHLDGCEHCLGRLARAAQLELSLRALARQQRCGTSARRGGSAPSPWPAVRVALAFGAVALSLLVGARASIAAPSHPSVEQ